MAPRPTGAPFPFPLPPSPAPPKKQNVLHEGSHKQKQPLLDHLNPVDCTVISLLIPFTPLTQTSESGAITNKRIKPSPIHRACQFNALPNISTLV
jgi:hypothetical protein